MYDTVSYKLVKLRVLTNLINSSLIRNISVKSVLVFFIVIEAISFGLYFSGTFSQYNLPNILSSGVIAVLVLIFVSKYTSSIGNTNKSELFFLLTLSCWFSAEILYGYLNGYLQIDAYPSIADVFYLFGYIFFISFLWFMNTIYKIELAYILSAIVTFSLIIFYVMYIAIFVYEIYTFSGSVVDLTLLFVYPIVDLFIVLGSIMFYFRGRTISINKGHHFWIFISAAGLVFFVADVIFGFDDLFKILTEDDIYLSDLFYNIGYLLFGIAFIVRIRYLIRSDRNNDNQYIGSKK
jgi:hypothetical protein